MKQKEKIILINSSILVIIILVVIFIILPLKNSLIKDRDTLKEQRINYEITKKRSQDLTSLKNKLEEIEEKNSTLNNFYIGESNELSLFKNLESLAKENDLSLNYNLETQKTNKSTNEVKLSINLGGRYQSILKYLAGIEALNYYIKINNLTIKKGTDDKTIASLEAITYWQ